MDNWHSDLLAEHARQQTLKQSEHAQLERLALQSRVYRPGLFERMMFTFANWMISTGSQLRKRYEIPTTSCNHPPSGSFVS